jgi:hypothetical protein
MKKISFIPNDNKITVMKNIVIAFFSVFLFCGCKKDSVDNIPIGTIKVDIDGTAYTFSVQAKATRPQVTGGFGVQIQGNYRTGSTTNLSFTIVRPTAITSGSYTENTASNPLVMMKHCTEVIVPCVYQANNYGSPTNPVSITITEITSSYVKGTFKGELQLGSGSTETLTNGMFYVSF